MIKHSLEHVPSGVQHVLPVQWLSSAQPCIFSRRGVRNGWRDGRGGVCVASARMVPKVRQAMVCGAARLRTKNKSFFEFINPHEE